MENQVGKTKENNSLISLSPTKIKEEPPSHIIFTTNETQFVDVADPPSSLQLVPVFILKQQKIQEENPDLRCGNCIGCFRDKDCGKCVVCMQSQNKDKLCMQRICVQIEELLQKKVEDLVNKNLNLFRVC